MKNQNYFLKKTLPYILAGTLFSGCGCSDKLSNQLTANGEIIIPKLPTYEPKDYILKGTRINGIYLQFLRDVSDDAYNTSSLSRGIHKIDGRLEKITGSRKPIGRFILKKDTNVLIVRNPENKTEKIFYDNQGAGEDNNSGDLWADNVMIEGNLSPCDRAGQREFAESLIAIHKYKQSLPKKSAPNDIKNKFDKIKPKSDGTKSNKEKNNNEDNGGFWKKIRSLK